MNNHRNGRATHKPVPWELTLVAEEGEPIVVTGLSDRQARRAISALVTGDDAVIEELTGRRSTATAKRAA